MLQYKLSTYTELKDKETMHWFIKKSSCKYICKEERGLSTHNDNEKYKN